MIISIVTYALLIGLILAGGKFAGIKGFNEDFVSLNKTKALRGLAALGVILHHVSQQGAFRQTNTLVFFADIGIYFVAIFFFCSGYGLVKSYLTKKDYLNGFIKNRIVKTLLVPFWVNSILYALFFYFVIGAHYPVAKWICGITGITLINEYAWFPIVISILYLAFYFVYKNCKSFAKGNIILAAVILLLASLFWIGGHFAWWNGPSNWYLDDALWEQKKWWMDLKLLWFSGEWWVNTCVAFLFGIVFGQNEEKVILWFKKFYWGKLISAVVIFAGCLWLQSFGMSHFGYWSELSGNGPGIGAKAITWFLQQPSIIMFIVVLFMLMMKFNTENPVTRFFGNISLETYLMNFMAVLLFWPLVYKGRTEEVLVSDGNLNLVLFEVGVVGGSILLGLVYRLVCKHAKKLIK